jgi:hypothetical protein
MRQLVEGPRAGDVLVDALRGRGGERSRVMQGTLSDE